MTKRINFTPGDRLWYQLHQIALRENRPISEVVHRAVERGIGQIIPSASVIRDDRDAAKVTAAYLSGEMSRCVHDIAAREGNSVSHVMRDLVGCELKRRGLLPDSELVAAKEKESA